MRKMKSFILLILASFITGFFCFSCGNAEKQIEHDSPEKNTNDAFWGDSTLTITAKNLVNGYKFSMFHTQDNQTFFRFQKDNSIDRIFAVHTIPVGLMEFVGKVGSYVADIDFPVVKNDTLGIDGFDMFFQDVNFDGKEDFIIQHEGYNRYYYAVFDIENGNSNGSSPGLLEAVNTLPYNNLVSGTGAEGFTVLDYKNKKIYIEEQIGCCTMYTTLAKYVEGEFGKSVVKVIEETRTGNNMGREVKEIYRLVNDTLKLVETKTK